MKSQLAKSARILLDLPQGLSFASGPGGFALAPKALGGRVVTRAERRLTFARNQTRAWTSTVRADKPGTYQIRARALVDVPGGTDAGDDTIFLTVGAPGQASRLSAAAPAQGGVKSAPLPATSSAPSARGPQVAVTNKPATQRSSSQAGSATSCAQGTWSFTDNTAALRRSRNYQVQVWDQDTFSADDLLATGVTFNGGPFDSGINYNVCFEGADDEGGGQEVYVRFVSANNIWRVRDTDAANNDYVNSTGVQAICDGCTANFGSLVPGNDINRGMQAFDAINKLWSWKPGGGQCFDLNDASCRQMVVNWTSTSTDGTYYNLGDNTVHLAAADPDADATVIHEGAHAAMDDVYEDVYPSAPNCNPHSIFGSSSTGCGWTEGFAEWVPARVLNDPFFRWPNGAFLNLEAPTWNDGNAEGDTVEGRVAGAMIDVSDAANDAPWDLSSEGDAPQWDVFLNTNSTTFADFQLNDRPTRQSTADPIQGSVYQNTINYGNFRDPLTSNVTLARPSLDVNPTPHNYGLNTSTSYWSFVAVRPPSGADYDLNVFDDRALGTSLASSTFGGNTIDYVAIDTNRRAFGDYYPRVYRFAGSGAYNVEWQQGTQTLADSSTTVSMAAIDIVQPYDSLMSAGVQTYFRVVPAAGQDVALLLNRSNSADSTTFVQGRPSAVASSDGGGAGGAEAFSYTDAASQWDGLVILNKSGSGTVSIFRDTTAPTGTVAIEGGAATARSTSATVNLSAADAQTGILDMRVAADGVLDTEAFEPYSATKSITLPSGDGAKTVAVQYRNQAGMVTTVTDSITLDTRPDLAVTALTNPPASLTRGQTFKVTDTTANLAGSAAVATKTRYFLSTDAVYNSTDKALVGNTRSVPGLAAGTSSTGNKFVSVPTSTAPGNYFLIACSDRTNLVTEFDETNNCTASSATATVKVPDLTTTALTNPPSSGTGGGSFSVTDSVKNNGTGAAGASTQAYYLSLDTTLGSGDITLTGTRAVPALNPGIISSGTVSVTIPSGTAAGTYRLLSCADSANVVSESGEANNCRASGAFITVT
ncbi:MAG: hypothetical protein HYX34_02040 [Actinobacteria bacterium]|nr:hypothetical protein [Actinomycetota bacterium]